MADIVIKVQGFYSWEEGKFSVEHEDLESLISNSDETDPLKKKYNYYSDKEIKCSLTIPWELLSLFNNLDTPQKLDRIVEEKNSSVASKIINHESDFKSIPIPRLFDEDTLEIFPYWMYEYRTSEREGKKKTGRSVMERNETTINPLLLELFLRAINEKVIPLNVFSKQDKVISFIHRAKMFCDFAKKYHIRISFYTNH